MLFSSHLFLTLFLPLSVLLYFLCSKINPLTGLLSIVVTSAIFYAWHHPSYLILLYFSILFNYYAAKLILSGKNVSFIFYFSVIVNVCFLLFFKYLNFFIENLNVLFSLDVSKKDISLPLAISFFTFQQIAFLVDVYKRRDALPSFLNYASFITFYPQLIAGPIVRHIDYLPQIQREKTFIFSSKNASIGFTLFVLGLFKKVMLADKAGVYADFIFDLAAKGTSPTLIEAWLGVLS